VIHWCFARCKWWYIVDLEKIVARDSRVRRYVTSYIYMESLDLVKIVVICVCKIPWAPGDRPCDLTPMTMDWVVHPYCVRFGFDKTLSTETFYQQGLIVQVGKLGEGMKCYKCNSTSNVLVCETLRKVYMYGCDSEWVGSVCVCMWCVCVSSLLISSKMI
jgi:hypothetical protein